MRVIKFLGLVLLLALIAAAAAAAFAYRDYQAFLDEPLAIEDGAKLAVKSGATLGKLATELESSGAIRSATYLSLYGRQSGLATRLQIGEYRLGPALTPRSLLDKLVAGDVVQYSLTVVEGWTFRQLRQAINSSADLVPTMAAASDAEIMAALGHSGLHPEGRFFPDTYSFPAGTSDLDFLRRAYDTMTQEMAKAWEKRTDGIPLASPEEALTLASIVERETGQASERAEIAGVFARRLQKKMRLQTDPTVIYGLGDKFDGNLRRKDLTTDTPYNTYTRAGLPPTPIALPGREALQAAVSPAPGETLYFVAKGDGSHAFSKTLKEHNRNVREYQLKKK